MNQEDAIHAAIGFSEVAHASEKDRIIREYQRKRREIEHRAAADGTLFSGGTIDKIAKLYAEQTDAAVMSLLNLILEGFEMKEVELDDMMTNRTIKQTMEHHSMFLAAAASHNKIGVKEMISGRAFSNLVSEHSEVSMASVKTHVERWKAKQKKSPKAGSTTYYVYGHNPRWNTNSVDQSVNVVMESNKEVFNYLRQAFSSQLPDGENRAEILRRIEALEKAVETASLKDRYFEFMAVASTHMTVLAPFIPALTQILEKALS